MDIKQGLSSLRYKYEAPMVIRGLLFKQDVSAADGRDKTAWMHERRPRVYLLLAMIDVAPDLRIGIRQKSGSPAASCITSPISLFLKLF